MERTTVVVFQDRTWYGNPQMGAFSVFLDGRRVGIATVHGQLELPVNPGRHVVRIGQMWFRSPPVVLDVAPGSTTRLRANIPLDLPLIPRLARFLVSPRRCLVLGETQTVAERAQVQRSLLAGQTVSKGLRAQGLIGTAGLALLLVGLKVNLALVVVGAVVFVAGTVLGVVGMIRAKRIDASDSSESG